MSEKDNLTYIHGVGWVDSSGNPFDPYDPLEEDFEMEYPDSEHQFSTQWMKKKCEHEWANISLFRIIYACKYCGEYKDKNKT